MMFKIGDRAVYPGQGVAEITGIESKQISNTTVVLYMLRVLDTDRKIMIPVSKVKSVGLRKVITDEEVEQVFDVLRQRTKTIDRQTWNRRYRRYVEKINTGSLFDIAEVMRDLSRLKYTKNLSFGERKMLDQARTLLVKEISVAKSMTEDEVLVELDRIIDSAQGQRTAASA